MQMVIAIAVSVDSFLSKTNVTVFPAFSDLCKTTSGDRGNDKKTLCRVTAHTSLAINGQNLTMCA